MNTTPFIDKFLPEPNSGCFLWTAYVNHDGYGTLRIATKPFLAHRVSYEAAYGKIPTGLEIDHLCRVRCCVNPAHLQAVTHQENIRRGNFSGTNKESKKTHCAAGHEYSAINTRLTKDGHRECRSCGRQRYWKSKKASPALVIEK